MTATGHIFRDRLLEKYLERKKTHNESLYNGVSATISKRVFVILVAEKYGIHLTIPDCIFNGFF
ncbi:hypothetical protein J6590_017176 [Homalodisca vitripennis]|nr:hypothetical protein J6590_017176 [Homalodisca vitripennis]